MASFAYRAIDQQGHKASGRLDALNAVDLEIRLRRLGLDLITFEPVKERRWLSQTRISRPELINFCFHLEQLLRSGVPILDALSDLRDTVEEPGFREIVAGLRDDIEGGLTLSKAMAKRPAAFDSVFVALVRAGEVAGNLPEVLAELIDNLKWQDELSAQTRRALQYPLFVGALVLAIFFILMIWLVPNLAVTLKQLSPKLPTETAFLISLATFMRTYWYVMLLLPIVIAAGLFALYRFDEAARLRWDSFKLRMPFVGRLATKIIMARFATFFALMYRAGISVLDCIHTAESIAGNRVVAGTLRAVGRNISEGMGITQAFTEARLFPPLVLRMLKVGESTGGLDKALGNVSYFYNREVKEEMSRLQQMIGPLTTVLLGILIAAIVWLMFLPIYDVISRVRL